MMLSEIFNGTLQVLHFGIYRPTILIYDLLIIDKNLSPWRFVSFFRRKKLRLYITFVTGKWETTAYFTKHENNWLFVLDIWEVSIWKKLNFLLSKTGKEQTQTREQRPNQSLKAVFASLAGQGFRYQFWHICPWPFIGHISHYISPTDFILGTKVQPNYWIRRIQLKFPKICKRKFIQRTQTPPRLWPLTLRCDFDLMSRSRKLKSCHLFCIVPWYQVWCLWV